MLTLFALAAAAFLVFGMSKSEKQLAGEGPIDESVFYAVPGGAGNVAFWLFVPQRVPALLQKLALYRIDGSGKGMPFSATRQADFVDYVDDQGVMRNALAVVYSNWQQGLNVWASKVLYKGDNSRVHFWTLPLDAIPADPSLALFVNGAEEWPMQPIDAGPAVVYQAPFARAS